MKRTLLIFILSLVCLKISAQSPLLWEKFYDQNGDERIGDISVCKDGSILFSGFSLHKTSFDSETHAWYGKVNSSGEKLWSGKLSDSKFSLGQDFIQTKDGRNFLVGYFDSKGSYADGQTYYAWIEESGTLSDLNFYGTRDVRNDFNIVMECENGTILAGGKAGKDMLLVRFSSGGKILASKNFTFEGHSCHISDFKENENGNIIMAGAMDKGEKDMLIFEVDSNLNALWYKTLDYAYLEEIHSVCIAQDGGYVVAAARYYKSTGSTSCWYAKLDNKGDIVWEFEAGQVTRENEKIKVVEFGEGRYALCRNYYGKNLGDNFSKNHDLRFVIFDENGKTLWEYTHESSRIEYFYDLAVGENMTLLAAGQILESDTASNGFIYCFKPQLTSPGIPIYVLSKEDNKPIQGATIAVKHEDGTTEQLVTSETGVAFVILKRNERCLIQIEALGYQSLSDAIALPAEGVKQENKYYLVRVKPGTNVVMKSVGFERSTTKLLSGSYDELDRLAQFMIDHPEIKIQLSGHTDNGGVAKANQLLSEQRVAKVKDYLVSKGIAAERITGKGYGGRKPIAPNDTEENKSKNRRVEVKLL